MTYAAAPTDRLPPIKDIDLMGKQDRQYRTSLTAADYLKLETEALQRGMKPYGLTQSIMTLYVNKRVLVLSDLTPDHQKQVAAFLDKSGYGGLINVNGGA